MCESPVICDLDIINKAADDPFHGSSQQRIYRQSSIVVFIVISPKWGLFGIINQIYHASVGILMKCLPSGGWFSLGHRPRENHPPSGRHFIRILTLAWHICIIVNALRTLHCLLEGAWWMNGEFTIVSALKALHYLVKGNRTISFSGVSIPSPIFLHFSPIVTSEAGRRGLAPLTFLLFRLCIVKKC